MFCVLCVPVTKANQTRGRCPLDPRSCGGLFRLRRAFTLFFHLRERRRLHFGVDVGSYGPPFERDPNLIKYNILLHG